MGKIDLQVEHNGRGFPSWSHGRSGFVGGSFETSRTEATEALARSVRVSTSSFFIFGSSFVTADLPGVLAGVREPLPFPFILSDSMDDTERVTRFGEAVSVEGASAVDVSDSSRAFCCRDNRLRSGVGRCPGAGDDEESSVRDDERDAFPLGGDITSGVFPSPGLDASEGPMEGVKDVRSEPASRSASSV